METVREIKKRLKSEIKILERKRDGMQERANSWNSDVDELEEEIENKFDEISNLDVIDENSKIWKESKYKRDLEAKCKAFHTMLHSLIDKEKIKKSELEQIDGIGKNLKLYLMRFLKEIEQTRRN